MLSDNIQALRKQKGYSQETLAERLHVVRQTVSKWEKGLSVPDAENLQAMAEIFEVSVSDLLGERISVNEELQQENEVAKQLSILNDQLASQSSRRRKMIRRSAVGIGVIVFILIAWGFFNFFSPQEQTQNTELTTVTLECHLNGQTYVYGVTYNEQYRIINAGGDAWIANHVGTEQYSDANIMIAQIEDYFTERGGSCEVKEEK